MDPHRRERESKGEAKKVVAASGKRRRWSGGEGAATGSKNRTPGRRRSFGRRLRGETAEEPHGCAAAKQRRPRETERSTGLAATGGTKRDNRGG